MRTQLFIHMIRNIRLFLYSRLKILLLKSYSYNQKYQTIPLFKTENSTSEILLTQILDRSM